MTRTPLFLAVAASLWSAHAVAAEPADAGAPSVLVVEGLGTPQEELARLADLVPGALAPRSGILRRGGVTERELPTAPEALPWGDRFTSAPLAAGGELRAVTPRAALAFQARAPGGANDGLLWQGRGVSTLVSGGVRARWRWLSAQLAPEVTWSQNAWFATVDTGEAGPRRFANPWYGDQLDLPQRFGAGPFSRAWWGQSYAQAEAFGVHLGFSTENLWWGPGIRNAVLLTNNAEGFPHVYLGTERPLPIGIGTLELEAVVGQLTRSRYHVHPGVHPAFSGLAVVYQPRWIPGLYVGGGRTFIESWASLRSHHYLSVFEGLTKSSAGGDNLGDNQQLSAWVRWVMPDIELYGEYAQDDFATAAGFVRVPDRTASWTAGFQKRWAAAGRCWRVIAEAARTRSNLPAPYDYPVYTHVNDVDVTNQGQLLGDWIGPGADTQYLAVDAFVASGRIGGYVERVRRNDEIFWRLHASSPSSDHDAELVFGVRQVLLLRRAEITWDVAAGERWNRDFIRNEPLVRAFVTVAIPVGAAR